jgi:cardiolipin synthase
MTSLIKIKDLFLLPNLLSLFRMILGFITLFLYIIIQDFYKIQLYLIFFIIFAYISDILDGFLARKYNTITELGKIIDPVADKIFIFAIVLILFLSYRLNSVIFYTVIIRDLLIISGSFLFTKKKNFVIPSNYFGKFTVFTLGIYLLILISGLVLPKSFNNFLQSLIVVLLVLSFFKYLFNAILILKGKN